MNFRVAENILFAFMPIACSIIMYLWVVLLADEFLLLLESSERIFRIIKKLKLLSFIIIAGYGAMALALWVNGMSHPTADRKKTKIISTSVINLGLFDYSHLTLTSWDGGPQPKNILLSYKDDSALYVGKDVEILLSEGTLSLQRVLEIRPDREKFYLKMFKAAPDSQIAMGGLVEMYSQRKEFGKALEWFDKLHEKYPGQTDIGHDLAGWLIDSRRYEQAAAVLKKTLETKREYEVLYLLGYALAKAGKKDEAEKYLIEATELDPTDFRAFHTLGYVYRDTERKEKAKEAWTRGLELNPNYAEMQKNIGGPEK